MKPQKTTVLFMDNSVTSKNFACHFLHYNIFCLQPFEDDNKKTNIKVFNFKQKQNPIFDIIVCLSEISLKTCDNIKSCLNAKGVVLTNNIATYLMLKQKNINCCFLFFNKPLEQQQEKITITCTQDFSLLPQSINIKQDELIVSKILSYEIINASVGTICTLKNKTSKALILSHSAKKQIIALIREQIMLTNSVMLTVEKYNNLNFYKFLSGRGLLKKISQYFNLASFLFCLNIKFNDEHVIESVENMLKLNFNNYIQPKKLNNCLKQLKKLQENKNNNQTI